MAPHPAEPGGAGARVRGNDVAVDSPVAALAQQINRTHFQLCELLAAGTDAVPDHLALGVLGHMMGGDQRMLHRVVATARPLANLWTAFGGGRLGWSQVRAITEVLRRVPVAIPELVDERLPGLIDMADGWDADQLVAHVDDLIATLAPGPDVRDEDRAERGEFVTLQPDLFGGGRVHGELGVETFASTVAMFDHVTARDGLVDTDDLLPSRTAEDRAHNARTHGRARAAALRTIADQVLTGDAQFDSQIPGGEGARPTVAQTADAPTAITLVVTLDSLARVTDQPARLLHTLSGGTLKVTARTARRWADERPSIVRTLVLDTTGDVLGVGRRQHRPPGWLRDTLAALHPTCVIPGCTVAADHCDADHHHEWDRDRGPTDLPNLGWLCRRHHRQKTRGDWQLATEPDGTRRVTHTPTGITCRQPPLPMFAARAGSARAPT